MLPVIALNAVEILDSFQLDDLNLYEFSARGLPDDSLAARAVMFIIDMDKALIFPGSAGVIICTRKSDREIVTIIQFKAQLGEPTIDVARTTDSLAINDCMNDLATSNLQPAAIEYISESSDPEVRNKLISLWDGVHGYQEQLKTMSEVTDEHALRDARNIEDFGVADPKPC